MATDLREQLEELLAGEAPPAGTQPEHGHERAERGGKHQRIRSASHRQPSTIVGVRANRRSSGIMRAWWRAHWLRA